MRNYDPNTGAWYTDIGKTLKNKAQTRHIHPGGKIARVFMLLEHHREPKEPYDYLEFSHNGELYSDWYETDDMHVFFAQRFHHIPT